MDPDHSPSPGLITRSNSRRQVDPLVSGGRTNYPSHINSECDSLIAGESAACYKCLASAFASCYVARARATDSATDVRQVYQSLLTVISSARHFDCCRARIMFCPPTLVTVDLRRLLANVMHIMCS